jgi:uncharacterized RDD family membrane protein YckC
VGSRLVAWVIDRLILGALWFLVAAWGFVAYLNVIRWPPDLLNLAALISLLLLGGIWLHAAYFIVFVGGCGQTPGKMLLRITVVRWDGVPAGYGRALVRWVGYWVAMLPLGLGFVPAFFTADRRGVHDWMAGTRVVCRQSALVPAAPSPLLESAG